MLLLSLTGCQHPKPPPPPPPKISYHENYDQEIKVIMELAHKDDWEQAQAKATALFDKDPKNPMVERVYTWVFQAGQKRREQALENKIRDIDAKNSVFSPTLPGLFTEKRDRGLPATKDVRDTVSRIENTPYIPESYNKTIHEKGPLFDFESTKGRMSKVLEKEVSIHLDNVPLETVILNLSQSAGINIVADKSLAPLKQTLSVNLDKVKLGEFLRYAGRNYDLQFQVGDELVWVVDAKDPKRLMEETRYYRLRKGFVLPAQFGAEEVERTVLTVPTPAAPGTLSEKQKFKRFVNDEAPVMPAMERAITNLFTGGISNTLSIKYMIDYERNLVVAKGTPDQLDVLEKLIQEFDRPIQQVLIEARFVTISKPAFLRLGVLWETGRDPSAKPIAQDFTGLVNNQNFPRTINSLGAVNPAIGLGIQESFTNILNTKDLTMTIQALEQSGESQTLSAPRLTVLNNRPATISDGKVQYYYEQYDVKQTSQQYFTVSSIVPSGKPTKITAGAELNVLASVSGDGKSILLALNPRVNTDVQLVRYTTLTEIQPGFTNAATSFDINLPQYRTQELSTRVAVKSGDTVVMGGVLERERSTLVESVPILGDIPLIGALFRHRTEVDTPRYLLVFVTATIVKDTGEFLVYEDEHSKTNLPSVSQ
jgi:type IV pilus assembly protein PilQ